MTKDSHHIAFFVPSLNIGGVESVFLTYSSMLVEQGYRVDLVVCKPEGALLDKLPLGVNLVHFGGIKLRNVVPYLRRYLKTSSASTFVCGPDITNFIAILVNLSLRPKERVNLIVTQHSVFDNDAKDLGLLGYIIPLGKRFLYRFASHVVAVSDAVARDLERGGVPMHKITIIYNPISVSKIELLANEPPSVDLPSKYLVFVGRLNSVKNVGLLIRAFELIDDNDLCLVIVGDGAMCERWQDLAREGSKNDRIIFTGSLSNPAPILRRASVVVVPSFSEAFPMVVVESLALGKTIVHTPNLGSVEILSGGYGYCSKDFDDAADFAKTLKEGLENPLKSAKLLTHVGRYDEDVIFTLLKKLI